MTHSNDITCRCTHLQAGCLCDTFLDLRVEENLDAVRFRQINNFFCTHNAAIFTYFDTENICCFIFDQMQCIFDSDHAFICRNRNIQRTAYLCHAIYIPCFYRLFKIHQVAFFNQFTKTDRCICVPSLVCIYIQCKIGAYCFSYCDSSCCI